MFRPATDPAAPPRSPSTNAPVFGLIRKFCPVLVTTRMRSAAGLKSNPKLVPLIGTGRAPASTNPPEAPTAVATPVR
jgi:hypothetical protein